ncbi:MAG: adenylate/guanylate cyclase domain-containing protein [Planctomycetes bacterium]|nr:adenylate/guanylate cyclase domain-containing protein [Planctomycetota bacterium]
MDAVPDRPETRVSQLRLFLEDLACDLCFFQHVTTEGAAAEGVKIKREAYLGAPGAYADVEVAPPGGPRYFVEIKHGYSSEYVVRSLRRKYGSPAAETRGAARVIVVIDLEGRPGAATLAGELAACLHPGLALELWDERKLLEHLRDRFQVEIESVTEADLLDVREAVDRAKGYYAFGGPSREAYTNDPLRAQLLWHFGFWRLRQIRESQAFPPRRILPPGSYQGVAVLMADLCSFSSYVRDTRDEEVSRHCLTSYYSKARYQVIGNGGMLYQFVGDEVVALFGIPDRRSGYPKAALDTAAALVDIGDSISEHWQRHIDRVQEKRGVHVGMAMGNLQMMSLRPFSRTHVGAIGDALNMAARLTAAAGPGEIVVSNALFRELDYPSQAAFAETEPVEARNVGRIKAWRWRPRAAPPPPHA